MRPPRPEDHDTIRQLLDDAFAPSQYESRLIDQLRASGKPILEWIIEGDTGVTAYICYTRAFRGNETIGYHLAPVAVRPDSQNKGLGSKLICDSLASAELGQAPVFVLGDPAYYPRFGFEHIAQPACPFDPGNEHFMAHHWSSDTPFAIGYEEEFYME